MCNYSLKPIFKQRLIELKVTSTLHCKTITFQNVTFESQIKNFFHFLEKLCSVLKTIVCTPPFCRGVEPPTKFSKREELDRALIFQRGVDEKEGGDLFERGAGCNFYKKNKQKSEKFNDKKIITKNSNREILTKNLVTFKR